MWSHSRYEAFLNHKRPGQMTENWYRWFVAEWNVARNIKKDAHHEVWRFLNTEFRQIIAKAPVAATVDQGALHIKQQSWSTHNGRPLSLVSKVAFFLRPGKFVPLDRFSLLGLNQLRLSSGCSQLAHPSYADYLQAFDEQHAHFAPQLVAAMKKTWVRDMAAGLSCPPSALATVPMRRKLFDNYLMQVAGRRS